MNSTPSADRQKGHNQQNRKPIRDYVGACLIVFVISSASSVAYAESGITRFLKNPFNSFVESRFQSLYHKRVAEQQTVKFWQEGGQWRQQNLTPDRILLFFDRDVETRIEEYDNSGKIKTITELSYDSEGNVEKKITSDGAGKSYVMRNMPMRITRSRWSFMIPVVIR